MKPYSRGFYNEVRGDEQRIRISEGCPNDCQYCYETKECGKEPIYFYIPKIIRNKVSIMDMNLIYKPKALDMIKELGMQKVNGKVVYYELICGIDFRYLTQDIANALKENRFVNIRFAWDYNLGLQYKIKDCINKLLKAGYKKKELMCFIISDWKIPYSVCCKKLDSLKIWNVQVSDCWFDNVKPPKYQCNYWDLDSCIDFRRRCREHNQMIRHDGIRPELKESEEQRCL